MTVTAVKYSLGCQICSNYIIECCDLHVSGQGHASYTPDVMIK